MTSLVEMVTVIEFVMMIAVVVVIITNLIYYVQLGLKMD